MNVHKPSQVTSTRSQEPPQNTDPPGANNPSDRRKGGAPLLTGNIIDQMLIKGVFHLIDVYKKSGVKNQPEDIYNNPKFGVAMKMLEVGLPADYRPYFSAAKNTTTNYFTFKGYLTNGGAINPDSIKYGSFATALSGIAHACLFYTGSTAQTLTDRVQLIINNGIPRTYPRLAPLRIDVPTVIKTFMAATAVKLSKQYTEDVSYTRLQTPQNEQSTESLKELDRINSTDLLRTNACMYIAGALLLSPVVKQAVGSALLSLVRNPSELFKSFTKASVPALITVGTGISVANTIRQGAARADYDAVSVIPHKFQSNNNGENREQ